MKKREKRKFILIIVIISIIISIGVLISFAVNFNKNKNNLNLSTKTTEKNIDNKIDIETNSEVDNKEETTKENKTTSTKSTTLKKTKTTKVKTTSQSIKTTTTSKKTIKTEVTTTNSTTTKNTTKTTTSKASNPNEIVRENVLDVKEGSEIIREETKYGVKITVTEHYAFLTYVDGSTEKIVKKTDTDFNRDGYNGTTDSFKSEAKSLVSKNKSVSQSILEYTNQYRNEVSVSSLTLDDDLSLAANIRALEIAWSGTFSHNRPNGTYFNTVIDEIGYSYIGVGENIASGQKNASIVSNAWKNSEGHYKNMVNANFNKLGVGMVEIEGTKYWVQLFSN